MINHVRTLLLNEPGPAEKEPPEYSAFIPPYEPIAYPRAVYRRLELALYGPGADKAQKEYVMSWCMRLLHVRFPEEVLAYDSRITYDLSPEILPVRALLVPGGTIRAVMRGTWDGGTAGNMKGVWRVEEVGPDHVLFVSQADGSAVEITGPFPRTVPLPGGPVVEYYGGTGLLTGYRKPTRRLENVLEDLQPLWPALRSAFSSSSYSTFLRSPDRLTSFTGLLMAWAEQLDLWRL